MNVKSLIFDRIIEIGWDLYPTNPVKSKKDTIWKSSQILSARVRDIFSVSVSSSTMRGIVAVILFAFLVQGDLAKSDTMLDIADDSIQDGISACCGLVNANLKFHSNRLIECINNTAVFSFNTRLNHAAPYTTYTTNIKTTSSNGNNNGNGSGNGNGHGNDNEANDSIKSLQKLNLIQGPTNAITIITRATSTIYSYASYALLIQAAYAEHHGYLYVYLLLLLLLLVLLLFRLFFSSLESPCTNQHISFPLLALYLSLSLIKIISNTAGLCHCTKTLQSQTTCTTVNLVPFLKV